MKSMPLLLRTFAYAVFLCLSTPPPHHFSDPILVKLET